MIWLNLLIFVLASFVLVRSGTWVIRSLSHIARFLRLSEFFVAFILMAFVSSLPELFVGISSAVHGLPQISFGNIIGANVINLTLAVGLSVLILGGIKIDRELIRRESFYTAVVAILPLFLILDGQLSRVDGVILLSLFFIYLSWLLYHKERFSRVYENHEKIAFKHFLKNIFLFLGSVALLIVSGEFIISSAISLAEEFNLSPVIIGVLIIGAGTALPETYFSIRAALNHKEEIVLGNLMGSVIITSLFVLGLVALLSPIEIDNFPSYLIARVFLLLSAVIFFISVRSGGRISRKEALFLIFIYIAFIMTEILIK
ncbi:MAG: sodium:calcium antiporter [Candidatus Nealsonbacteria bacterium]